MKKMIPVLLLLLGAITANAQQQLVIRGNITGDTKGYNKIYLFGGGMKKDSTTLVNNTFVFTIPYTLGVIPVLYSEYDVRTGRYPKPTEAFIDAPGELVLKDADITKGLGSGTWTGNAGTEEFKAYSRQLGAMKQELTNEMKAQYTPEEQRTREFRLVQDSIYMARTAVLVTDFVRAHPNSYAATVALQRVSSKLPLADLEQAAALLSAEQQQNVSGKAIAELINGRKRSKVGATVSDFSLPAPDGEMQSFRQLQGKYVLIDFWASWCGPCKRSFPHMKELYAKYKSDRFEIYSISIDSDQAAWLKELHAQALPWKQALDTKKIARSAFAVTAVPTTFLVDPNGKILLMSVGLDSSGNSPLEKKLQALFAEKG